MTITPWSDAAKALVGAAFGNPEMRAKQEEMQLKKDQFDLEQKKYGLDEAYNPARIGQAEASAGLDRAKAATEAISQAKSQIELDNILKFLEGPQTEPTMAPMPEFNPYNVGPQGQGRNPAMVLPYDQIKPLDSIDTPMDVSQLPPMPSAPPNPMTMGQNMSTPRAPDPFGDLITSLTSNQPAVAQPANGAQFFEQPVAPAAQAPMAPTDIMTPEIRQMIAAGYLKPENIGDVVLAAEGQGANRGVTDPQKRITNAAAGTGTFLSPDQILAQALGATRDTATLGNLAETNLGTADMQNFQYEQQTPGFTDFLDRQNATPSFSVTNPDGTVVNYGKPGAGGKPPTEAQGKFSVAANQLAAPVTYIENAASAGYVPSVSDYLTYNYVMQNPGAAVIGVQNMSVEGQKFFQSLRPVVAQAIFIQSGQAATEQEVNRKILELTPVPGEDQSVTKMKLNSIKTLSDTVKGLAGPALEGTPLGQGQSAPVQVTSDADYEALAPGTSFLAPDGTTRVKP